MFWKKAQTAYTACKSKHGTFLGFQIILQVSGKYAIINKFWYLSYLILK